MELQRSSGIPAIVSASAPNAEEQFRAQPPTAIGNRLPGLQPAYEYLMFSDRPNDLCVLRAKVYSRRKELLSFRVVSRRTLIAHNPTGKHARYDVTEWMLFG